MRGVVAWFGLSFATMGGALGGCEDPGAKLEMLDARAFRADGRVVVDIDLRAHEALGGNFGIYCTSVTFPGQERPAEQCSADLEDGDTKTVRLLSDGWVAPGASMSVRVRWDRAAIVRTLAAPPS
ncbi:MAG TPA: hypothetical protein VM580_20595 [Labilithrix sp.]|jgi:hypothetical protein|nr:hypothetical protein [Labilithrix sp.]